MRSDAGLGGWFAAAVILASTPAAASVINVVSPDGRVQTVGPYHVVPAGVDPGAPGGQSCEPIPARRIVSVQLGGIGPDGPRVLHFEFTWYYACSYADRRGRYIYGLDVAFADADVPRGLTVSFSASPGYYYNRNGERLAALTASFSTLYRGQLVTTLRGGAYRILGDGACDELVPALGSGSRMESAGLKIETILRQSPVSWAG